MTDTLEVYDKGQHCQETAPATRPPELPLTAADLVRKADAKENRVVNVNEALQPAYQKASTLQLTEDERKTLTAQFADEAVERRPHDGLLYIPHIEISDRLCQVFGPGQWCTIRRREWIEGTRIYAEWVLLIRGCFIGESVGAMDYHPNNPKMNYSDALEGTRGECIRRIAAKELACGSQVWRPSYCRAWEVRNPRGQRPSTAFTNPVAPKAARQPAPAKAATTAPATGKPFKSKEQLIKLLERNRGYAESVLRERSILLPTETLEDWGEEKLPQTNLELNELLHAIQKASDADQSGVEQAQEAPPEQDEFAINQTKPGEPPGWRDMVVPFGKDAGKRFGDLAKGQLWWWCTAWKCEGREYKGKWYDPKPEELKLREVLDKVRDVYGFTEAKQ